MPYFLVGKGLVLNKCCYRCRGKGALRLGPSGTAKPGFWRSPAMSCFCPLGSVGISQGADTKRKKVISLWRK